MSRYIEVEALETNLREWQADLVETYGINDEYVQCLEIVIDEILSMTPTADVAPAHYAAWVKHPWAEEVEEKLIDNYECTYCHNWARDTTRYCQSCGARMGV